MIKVLARAVAVLSLWTLAVAPALADANTDAKKALQALYDKTDAATAKKDIKGLTAYLAPDFQVLSDKGGKAMNLEQAKSQMGMVFKQVQSFKAKSVVQKVTLKGSTATVTVKQNVTAAIMNPQTGKPSKLLMDVVAEDIWVKSGAGWKEKSSKSISTKQSLDGKSIAGPGGR